MPPKRKADTTTNDERPAKRAKSSGMVTRTYTFGDVAENHARNQQLGERAEEGFSVQDLRAAKAKFEDKGVVCELLNLAALAGISGPPLPEAEVLIVRQALHELGTTSDALEAEIAPIEPDKKVKMYGKVVNKHARWNLCMDDVAQAPDYETGKGTVVAFSALPQLAAVRAALPQFLGPKAQNLLCELNVYYDTTKCGIGYHGDSERRKVVAIRLGASIPMCYQWFVDAKPLGARIVLPALNHGDLYVMSEKAVGTDWKSRKNPTLRHAAGTDKFTIYKK